MKKGLVMEIVRRLDDDERRWKLGYLRLAADEAHKFLTEEQYEHAVQQFEELSKEEEPSRSQTCDVRKIDEFWELRDKGGILRKINLRVYFTIEKGDPRMIVVLGAYKKEDEGQAPRHLILKMKNRQRFVREKLNRIRQQNPAK